MKKIFMLIASIMIFGGCASTKTLEPNLSAESNKVSKLPYVLAIDGQQLIGAQTQQDLVQLNLQ